MLRGLVMVIMALDHVRDYFTAARFDAADLSRTTTALFLTRWITHFCAPVFVLLAGTSVWLAGRTKTRKELAGFLLTRGAWLLLLEFTVISFAWYLNFSFEVGFRAQVIWAIGMSMIVLAGLVYLPRNAILAFAIVVIAGHNLLDGVSPQDAGPFAVPWTMLHVQAAVPVLNLFVTYPLLPWIGVMALGYLLGPVLELPAERRRSALIRLGLAMVGGFLILRLLNVYGDPVAWSAQHSGLFTFFSFVNVTKYPASLQFILLTVGVALVALAWAEQWRGRMAESLRLFGQVPLFYYVAHLYLIHLMAIAGGLLQGFEVPQMARIYRQLPPSYGYGLPVVYLVWVVVVLALWPLCRWFRTRKQAGRAWWWAYL